MVEEIDYGTLLKTKTGFSIIYDLYFDKALRTAKAILKSESLAADAVQETFIRIYKNSNQYDRSKSFKAWFNTILINECRRILEKEKKVTYLNEWQQEKKVEDIWHNGTQKELEDNIIVSNMVIGSMLEQLEDKIRIPLILKYLQDMKIDEIAKVMGLNGNTVKSRLSSGRNKLRQLYKHMEEESYEDKTR